MKYFVTADTHFGHGKIIEYCGRPFKDSTHMNNILIHNWNMRVKAEDTVFILGDFCFRTDKNFADAHGVGKEKSHFWLNQLNGNKILIRGNHDNNNSAKSIIDCIHITYGGHRINMVHKPEHNNPDFKINLVGHVHEKWLIKRYKDTILFNVGVDQHKFMPITLDEALGKIQKLKNTSNIEFWSPRETETNNCSR